MDGLPRTSDAGPAEWRDAATLEAQSRAADAERLVRALAKPDPINYDYLDCWWCDESIGIVEGGRGIDHAPDCPWMTAIETLSLPVNTVDGQYRHVRSRTD